MDHLSGLSQYSPTVNITVTDSGKNDTSSVAVGKGNNAGTLTLRPGDVIQGEIVGLEGNQVKIATVGKQVLTAQLEQQIDLLIGQKMLFSVRGSGDSQVTLSPLFENMAKQETANIALKEANLPLTENNLKLVSVLMEEGMSIDKTMLSQMNKAITAFPDASMETLAQLTKMQIPITNDNIQQFQQYLQNQNQIVQGMQDLLEQVPENYQQMVSQGNTQGANVLLGQFLEIISENTPENQAELTTQEIVAESEEQMLDQNSVKQNGAFEQPFINNSSMQEDTQESNATIVQAQNSQSGLTETQTKSSVIPNDFSTVQRDEIVSDLKNIGISQETLQQFAKGELSTEQLLKTMADALKNNNVNTEELQNFLKSNSFKQLTQKAVTKQWLMKPQDVAQENSITKLYERIDRQTTRLQNAMQQAGQEASILGKTVQNMRANITFMNDLNHMFSYVQLPLKFSEGKAHGDLYVYTNKKSLAQKNGEVSALLHLDMENLGPLDVHVLLQNGEKVCNKFYVQDDTVLDLISEHIDILNQALQKKGYQATTNVQITEKEKNVMQEILEEQNQHVPIAKHSFDMRA